MYALFLCKQYAKDCCHNHQGDDDGSDGGGGGDGDGNGNRSSCLFNATSTQ